MNKYQLIFSTVGLFLDFIGVLMLIIFPNMTKGAITPADEEYSLGKRFPSFVAKYWLNIAIILIIIGFLFQLIGNFIVILSY